MHAYDYMIRIAFSVRGIWLETIAFCLASCESIVMLRLYGVLVFLCFAPNAAGPRGTLKRRLVEAEAAEDDNAPGSSTDGAARRGPLRRRLADALRELPEAEDERDLPMTTKLKLRWARGQISSAVVQEFAGAALEQGARGLST